MRSTDEQIETYGLEVAIVDLPARISDYDLVEKFMRLRKQVFIDRMDWSLIHTEGVEFEQYDTFTTTYVLVHRNREVLGGVRLKRTDATHGTGSVGYSYMIRDAHLGLLPGMPPSLCTLPPPVDPEVWELTRLVAVPDEPGVTETVLRAANALLATKEATTCLFLGPPAFMRMAKKLGWAPEPMGPIVGNEDGRFLAFSCGVVDPAM